MRKLVLLTAALVAVSGGQDAFGGTPGPLSANPDPIDFQTVAAGDTPTVGVDITNTDDAVTVTIDSVGTSGGGGDLSAGNGCDGAVLAPHDSCRVNVSYSPSSGGSIAGASLDVTDDDASSPQSFAIQGSAVAHRFAFTSTPNASFGTVAVGDTAGPKQLTVRNQTDFSADPNARMTGSGDFNLSGCGAQVGGGSDCTASVTFSPSSQGAESATLQIDGDSFEFSGTGADQVTVSPAALPFGDQHVGTNSAPLPVTVTNNRTQAISVGFTNGNTADYSVDASDCAGQLGSGASCTLRVTFSPNAVGTQNGTLTVEGHAVLMTGRGTAAMIEVTPGSISFGNQPVFTLSATETVTVRNTGNEAMRLGAPSVGGNNPLQFTISDNCQGASPLQPGGQCTVTVTFTPSVTGGLSATLQMTSDAISGPDSVSLSGTGTPSAVIFAPGPVPFTRPHHAGTYSSPKTITLTNRTNGPLTIASVHLGGQNPRSFRITGGTCSGSTIPADGTCTETVRFAPNAVGVKGASLDVTDSGPNSPHSVALTGTSTYPKDDIGVHGAVGCDATKLTFRRGGTSRRFYRTVIVRSRTHVPTGPHDGTRRPHGSGVLHDRGLRHFTTYQYRVFALYRSRTRPGTFNHSRGVILHLRTGQLCTPMDGAVISDTTPTASWLPHPTLFGYSFLLFHGEDQIQQKRSLHSRSFTFSGGRRLRHGRTYTLFLYAYPASQPDGVFIGSTTFRVR
jgi:ASPM-SPD-2-Hydin domain-containing protein